MTITERLNWDEIKKIIQKQSGEFWTWQGSTCDNMLLKLEYLESIMPQFPAFYFGIFKINEKIDWEETVKQSISFWHVIVGFLRRIDGIQGFNIFKKMFRSDPGFLQQLWATIYLQNSLPIISIEKDDTRDVDVAARLGGFRIYFHIKSLFQSAKWSNLFSIDQQISERLCREPVRSPDGHRLILESLSGCMPDRLSPKELDSIFQRNPRKNFF